MLHVYGAEQAGRVNGVIARGQQLARAAGPVSAAALASIAGYGMVFAALAALLVAAIVVTPIRRTPPRRAITLVSSRDACDRRCYNTAYRGMFDECPSGHSDRDDHPASRTRA